MSGLEAVKADCRSFARPNAGKTTERYAMKYDHLLTVILAPDNLWTAAAAVVRNRGAAGVDGMRVDDLEAYLHENWAGIRARILAGEYHPQPVRGVEIPKPSGGTRLLGIPTVVDRTIQQAIQQVLSRAWDATFSPFSYGFRPGRNAHQALEQSLAYINVGYQDIIDLDLKSFFDRVNHDILMGLLRRRISDPMLLRLIRRYLQSGMLLGGVVSPRSEGTPQGGPLSPLLSNILLDEFDRELTRRGHRFVRYADDCSIFLRSPSAARRVRASVERWLETKLRLVVNAQKTVICRPVKFTLLGYGFVPSYRKGERGVYRLRIAATSWKRLREKVKRITRKTLPLTLAQRIARLNRLLRGWNFVMGPLNPIPRVFQTRHRTRQAA